MVDDKRRSVACLLAITLAAGCGRELEPPVAPFGGELAAALPSCDVIGLLRFRPQDAAMKGLAALIDAAGERTGLQSWLAPASAMFGLLEESKFVARDEPFAVLLLDTSVHGGLTAFAWRGGAEPFRAAARARGWLRDDPDELFLPGAARIDDMLDMMLAISRRQAQRAEDGEEVADEPIERTPFHLVERDGTTLLLPARDGARNLFAALERTHALDPDAGVPDCFRLALGPTLHESRDSVDNFLRGFLNVALAQLRGSDHSRFGVDAEVMNENYWRIYYSASRLLRKLLDFADSIDHLFVQIEPDGAEIFVRADEDGFFRRLLPLARNLPLDELLQGAPMDADLVVASAVDPSLLDDVESLWVASTRNLFQQEQRRIRLAERDADEEGEPRFLDSFGGRCWIALKEKEAAAGAAALPLQLRLFAQMVNDDANEGMVRAIAREVLPEPIFQGVQTASVVAYAATRAPGGILEVVGSKPSELLASERRRLAAPEAAQIPDGQPPAGFLFVLGGFADSMAITCTRDPDGIRVKITLPRRS